MGTTESVVRIKDAGSEGINAVSRPISLLKIYHTPYIDSTGIPLSSDRSYPDLIKDIDWDYQPAPSTFRGSPSRYPDGSPHVVPISGLERNRLRDNYPKMLLMLGELREQYIRYKRGDSDIATLPTPLTIAEMREFLRGLIHLPHYLVHRGKNPVPSQGVLAPSVLLLSNSAAGSLAALETYATVRKPRSNKVPEPENVIADVERGSNLMGEKTMCVAAPAQMNHFLSAVINGSGQESGVTAPLVSPKETFSFFEFGHHAYVVQEFLGELWAKDNEVYKAIGKQIKNGHNPRRYQAHLDIFLREAEFAIIRMQPFQDRINVLLGRSTSGKPLKFEEFGVAGFKMPALLEMPRRRS